MMSPEHAAERGREIIAGYQAIDESPQDVGNILAAACAWNLRAAGNPELTDAINVTMFATLIASYLAMMHRKSDA